MDPLTNAPTDPPDAAPDPAVWMAAPEAARCLGVSRATLYAYVSRGLLRSRPLPGRRGHGYLRSEVQRLALRRAAARRPAQVARGSLDWGLPVLGSALTLIRDGRLYYRGTDAVALAQHASLEAVAARLWDTPADPFAAPPPRLGRAALAALRALAPQPPALRYPAALAWLQASLTDVAPEAAAPADPLAACAQLVRLVAAAITLRCPTRAPLHRQLGVAWGLDALACEPLRRALVLCADHELNASSFTVRCVAATGAGLGACLLAGLAALSGPRHGGMTEAVEQWWDDCLATHATAAQRRRWLAQWLRGHAGAAGEPPPGFGHPLYPDGDPRAMALLAALAPDPRRDAWVALVQAQLGQAPTLDFALVALRRALGLPRGAAFALFALGRSAGWLAHALEQAASPGLIRPRAAYVGVLPPDPAPVPRGRIIRRR